MTSPTSYPRRSAGRCCQLIMLGELAVNRVMDNLELPQ
ncbi:hypothetical protein PseAD21_08390 [Pseudomonas sp. AD21]|jgi:hypothetical protein|nr:hypothetical protein PseAD21_08390 [Pseudomonas sp. AD21]